MKYVVRAETSDDNRDLTGAARMELKLIEKQVIFEGRMLRLEVHHLRDEAANKRVFREVVVHPGAVVVLPFVDEQTIVLIRNRRYVVGQQLIELPAGTLEKTEPPMNCAGRELLEETGYLAGKIKVIGNFFTSPGILTEKIYAFAAYDLQKQTQKLDEGEDIELLQTSFTEALDMIRHGEITDAKTIATILMYKEFGARVG